MPPAGGNAVARDPSTWAKVIAVYLSKESPLDGFHEAGRFTLAHEPEDQSFKIGQTARFLKLRVLENSGGRSSSLGSVKIIEGEAPNYTSVLLRAVDEAATSGTAAAAFQDAGEEAVEVEPNDTVAQANPMMFGKAIKGGIDPPGEKDYFKF